MLAGIILGTALSYFISVSYVPFISVIYLSNSL
jgi:hypothetical protein